MRRVPAVPLAAARRGEAEERERDGGESRDREDREHGGRARDRLHLVSGGGRGRDEPLPRIRHEGRAGVRDERERFPPGQPLERFADAVVLVVPWQETRGVVRPNRAKRFPVRRVSSQ